MKRDIVAGQGDFHYVTFSTYGRRTLLSTPLARQIVISVLGQLVRRGKVRVSGFVIMHDHVHAILRFDDDTDLLRVLQTWKSMSAHYLRKHYEKTMPDIIDHLRTHRSGREVVCFWQRRYYDFNINTREKLHEKLTYMHENPVRKGIVQSAAEYKWSSASWYYFHRSVGVPIDAKF
jgi:putative transposase